MGSTFIDDIMIIRRKSIETIKKLEKKLAIVFKMIDIRPISFYLGLKFKHN